MKLVDIFVDYTFPPIILPVITGVMHLRGINSTNLDLHACTCHATIVAPLTELLSKDAKFSWFTACENAVLKLTLT